VMNNIFLANAIYILFLIFFTYFLILMLYSILLALVGFFEGKKKAWEGEEENYPIVYFSAIDMPVSLIIPARNEEAWIRDAVLAVLALNYPQFELIVVDDGSTDKTFAILNEVLDLAPMDKYYMKHYQDGKVSGFFKSKKFPTATVLKKFAGKKKAGAVNAGLNIAKYNYVCPLDADTILEQNSVLKVMAHVQKDPDKIIGIGSYFGLSNGFEIKDGKIMKKSFPYNPMIAYQNIEYIRSFIGNRIGWSKFNSTPIVAGGFGVWRKDILSELGGYSAEFTCEDLELTFRAQEYIARNKEKGYKILMLPYYVCWTEGPDSVRSLILQRNRWQRVTDETVWNYKHMLFNPRYGRFGFTTLPYFAVYESLGVLFEVASLVMVTIGWASGMLDISTFFAFIVFMILCQTLVSLVSMLTFVRIHRLFKLRYLMYLIGLSFLEFFWYRWIISVAKLLGTLGFLRGVKSFDQYARVNRENI